MRFSDPWRDYSEDPAIKRLVDALTSMILECELTPADVRKAAMMAAIRAESMLDRRGVYVRVS